MYVKENLCPPPTHTHAYNDGNYRMRKWKENQYVIPKWRISNIFLYHVEYLINSITVSYSNKSYYCSDLWKLERECNRNFLFNFLAHPGPYYSKIQTCNAFKLIFY